MIPIVFSGVTTLEVISTVVAQIESTWTGNFGGYDVTTTVRVLNDALNYPVGVIPANEITLGAFSGPFSSNTQAWGLSSQWDLNSSSPNTFAHETSHLLGLPDQFNNANDITYGNQSGRSPAATPSASDILGAVNNNPWPTCQ